MQRCFGCFAHECGQSIRIRQEVKEIVFFRKCIYLPSKVESAVKGTFSAQLRRFLKCLVCVPVDENSEQMNDFAKGTSNVFMVHGWP